MRRDMAEKEFQKTKKTYNKQINRKGITKYYRIE